MTLFEQGFFYGAGCVIAIQMFIAGLPYLFAGISNDDYNPYDH